VIRVTAVLLHEVMLASAEVFMNYVISESTDAFKHGFDSPEFQAQLK
jgi:hypothetical protein